MGFNSAFKRLICT